MKWLITIFFILVLSGCSSTNIASFSEKTNDGIIIYRVSSNKQLTKEERSNVKKFVMENKEFIASMAK